MMALISLLQSYVNSNEQATLGAYEKFETFQRSEGMNVNDYINEFEQSNQKLVTCKIELPSAVRAYIKKCEFTKGKTRSCRSHSTLPYL